MTEQQTNDFALWFEQFMDPELNLTPGDKELCQHAWQAALSHAERREFQTEQDLISFLDGLYETAGPDSSALTGQKWAPAQRAIEGIRSHAEGEAVPVAEITIDRHGDAHFKACPNYLDLDQGTYQLYTHPAPAGERYSPSAAAAMQGLGLLRSAVHCGDPWDNSTDDAYETVKAFIGQRPVSDPDGFEQVLEELRSLHAEMTNADLVGEGNPEIVGYCVTGKQLDRLDWLLTCAVSAGLNSAPAPDEREIAAKALSDFADRMGAKHGDTENGQFFIDCAEQAHEEATRLRAAAAMAEGGEHE